ncbi:hypothetical protein WR25_07602 [Diploscapter pachys]|uniref:Calcineurin-like phosphoesterase domain-containing protein n=1 Tax=Diploscapter pachys TaxID=2018661 RepID=A0A2A2LCX6_9BILA|nr:hypothetical protein WR25_07602 [Diploscapter pachys]
MISNQIVLYLNQYIYDKVEIWNFAEPCVKIIVDGVKTIEKVDDSGGPAMGVFEESPPKDKGNFVFYCVVLIGLGVLMPWNMFITIAPQYYVEYWFSSNGTSWYSNTFMSSLTISSQTPNACINLTNIFLAIAGSLVLRVALPILVNTINVITIIALIYFFEPNEADYPWFYGATLGIVVVINISNGLYENSVFGIFADFPFRYTNALIVGNNMCGIFISLISIAVTLLIPDDPRRTALIYFTVSLGILLVCAYCLWSLTGTQFFKYYQRKGNEVRMREGTQRPGLGQFFEAFRRCGIQLFNIWFNFVVTLCIFPVMMTATPVYKENPTDPWSSFIPENIYTLVTTFLVFNLFATFGSFTAHFYQWPKPENLVYVIVARFAFIPFFMFMNYRPHDRTWPVLVKSQWAFVFGGAAMSFSSGYCSSLGMMNAPRVVPPGLSRIAGQAAAFCLIFGLFCGAALTFVVAKIITWADMAIFLCDELHIEDNFVCDYIVGDYRDEVVWVLGQVLVTPNQMCGILVDDCDSPFDPLVSNWLLPIPGNAPPFEPKKPVDPGKPTLRVLHLTDPHLDMIYTPGMEVDCDTSLCCRQQDTPVELNSDTQTTPGVKNPAGHWGSIGKCDTPYYLFQNMLQHIVQTNGKIDYIVMTGDLMSHDVWNYNNVSHMAFIKNISDNIKT